MLPWIRWIQSRASRRDLTRFLPQLDALPAADGFVFKAAGANWRDFERKLGERSWRWIRLFGATQEHLETLATYHPLEGLLLADFDRRCTVSHPTVKHLCLYQDHTQDLSSLGELPQLETLVLQYLPSTFALEPRVPTTLRLLWIGMAGRTVKIPTLRSLSDVSALEELRMFLVYPSDGSLHPLFGLSRLKVLRFSADAFPLAELAAASVELTSLDPPIRPVLQAGPGRVVLCGQPSRIVGDGSEQAACHQRSFGELRDEYLRLRSSQ